MKEKEWNLVFVRTISAISFIFYVIIIFMYFELKEFFPLSIVLALFFHLSLLIRGLKNISKTFCYTKTLVELLIINIVYIIVTPFLIYYSNLTINELFNSTDVGVLLTFVEVPFVYGFYVLLVLSFVMAVFIVVKIIRELIK